MRTTFLDTCNGNLGHIDADEHPIDTAENSRLFRLPFNKIRPQTRELQKGGSTETVKSGSYQIRHVEASFICNIYFNTGRVSLFLY